METIARVKREKNGEKDGEKDGETETALVAPSDTAETAAADKAIAAANVEDGDQAAAAATSAVVVPIESAPAPELAPDPAVTAAAAVNRLSPTELQEFLDRLWPAHKRAFEQKFGARNSANTNAEIATLAGECSALLTNPGQNTGEIRRKLARIKTLAGGDKERTSNAQLDRSALRRGLGIAGPAGEKFTTINMAPDSADGVWK
jgi:hypothetical protein